jgi:hypothetical protein
MTFWAGKKLIQFLEKLSDRVYLWEWVERWPTLFSSEPTFLVFYQKSLVGKTLDSNKMVRFR